MNCIIFDRKKIESTPLEDLQKEISEKIQRSQDREYMKQAVKSTVAKKERDVTGTMFDDQLPLFGGV